MDFTLIQSLWSIVVLITFIGIVLWAYSSKRKSAFDEAAHLPFDDETPGDTNKPFSPKTPARSK
jgi:cytochrome c oxidase cbb3-type subunit 4